MALGFSTGQVLLLRPGFVPHHDESGRRQLRPALRYPYGEELFQLDEQGRPLHQLVLHEGERELLLAARTGSRGVWVERIPRREDFLSGEARLQFDRSSGLGLELAPQRILLGDDGRRLLLVDGQGLLRVFAMGTLLGQGSAAEALLTMQRLTADGSAPRGLVLLSGGQALLSVDSKGQVVRFLAVRDGRELRFVPTTRMQGAAASGWLLTEPLRKNFALLQEGMVSLFNATSGNRLLTFRVAGTVAVRSAAFSSRGDRLLLEDDRGRAQLWNIDNAHPEVSARSLLGKVWYEGYQEPAFVWQSSSATDDFEEKFSIVPLFFGTLKAAFYALALAATLALLAAIFTSFFMAERMRRQIKPVIEMMEALPTVVLGFLAGLWLAPVVEMQLAGILLLLALPLPVLLVAWLWNRAGPGVRRLVPDGWEAALLIPVVLLSAWGLLALGEFLENALLGMDLSIWIGQEWGISYDQRNAMVVGIAMAFAVIPVIFSIADDALYSVPRSLVHGSLAMGATRWQTLVRVLLPTASPGLFSALMIGFGRAVGETMIVLMATGNTPIMEMNPFQGLRTLSANIAVETPEAEVGSSHFRVLFLFALVLFLFTFTVNALAETVRQRLRHRYGNL